ncbi:DUF7373 family lipoprotein [Gordonia phthalatica]|uniref:Lipoprotein n=1 Tax=Gordonia phthalatica TaxID=1136941 RepID=A0A0N9MQX2_9ACTN|nr:hypothetical protein [Gordonia phthalatica]ALG84808.1 hypothetical protein ACH46_10235 [Gordonia phthalatica]
MRKGATVAAALMMSATAVAGCAVDGTATRGPIQLDTGKYLAQQSMALKSASTDGAWAQLRGVRLADHIIFPREVDSGLVSSKFPLQPLSSAQNAGGVFGGGEVSDLPVLKQFQYGFVVTAGEEGAGDLGISHAVLVFDSPASAARAAYDISKTKLKKKPDEYTTNIRSKPVPGAPDGTRAVESTGVYQGKVQNETVEGFTPVGSMLMYTWGQAKDLPRAENIVKTALTKQKALLDPAPTISDDRNPDPTGLIRGTLVGEGGGDPMEKVVFSARGAALTFDDQPAAYEAMKKTGVTEVALNGTKAYRTGSADQAKTFADFLRKEYAVTYTATKAAASPRDLGGAHCWNNDDRQFGCTVVVDRYVGFTLSRSLKDAQQQISAQSVFLSKL